MKHAEQPRLSDGVSASLPGNGERGLKPRFATLSDGSFIASLPGNGERGLKQARQQAEKLEADRFAPRQRGAWIETLL